VLTAKREQRKGKILGVNMVFFVRPSLPFDFRVVFSPFNLLGMEMEIKLRVTIFLIV